MDTDGDEPTPEPTRAERVARAWELTTGNAPECRDGQPMDQRSAARVMGVSQMTISRYVREAQDSQIWIDATDRAEGRQALAVRTVRILDRLDKMMTEDPDRTLEVAPVWFKGAGQLAQLLGLNAPTRVQNETVSRTAAEPDPEITAAVSRAQQRAARERAEIRGETPLVVPPDESEGS